MKYHSADQVLVIHSRIIDQTGGAHRRREGLKASLSYALPDIEQLERQGKTKRREPHRLPDFYSLSTILRTLGAYLDAKGAELIELQKRPLPVTLLYCRQDGHPDFEERSIASFYDFFLGLHGRRRVFDDLAVIGGCCGIDDNIRLDGVHPLAHGFKAGYVTLGVSRMHDFRIEPEKFLAKQA